MDVDIRDLREYLVADARPLLLVVLGGAALVLVIACTNLLSAQLARAWTRASEVLVRTALGASRGRLLRQLMIENAILVLAGAAAGLGLAVALTRLVAFLGADQLPRLNDLSIDGRSVGFTVAVSMATLVVVGIIRALRLSRADAAGALPQHARCGRRRTGVGLAHVAGSRNRARPRIVDRIGAARPDARQHHDGRHRLRRARAVDGVHHADRARCAPRGRAARFGVAAGGRRRRLHDSAPAVLGANAGPVRRRTVPPGPNWPAFAGFRMVSPGYFEVLRQPVLQGRAFTQADGEHGEPVAIITPGIAQALWPGQNPVGQTIGTNGLVGRVAHRRRRRGRMPSIWSQPKGSQNEILSWYEQHLNKLPSQGQIIAMIRASRAPGALSEPVRQSLRRTLPDSPALIRPMEARIEQSAASRRFVMVALTTFASVAIRSRSIGIYGVMWYLV